MAHAGTMGPHVQSGACAQEATCEGEDGAPGISSGGEKRSEEEEEESEWITGQVLRRRKMRRNLLLVYMKIEGEGEGGLVLLVMSVETSSSEVFEEFRANVRPGDRIRVTGKVQEPGVDAVACQFEVFCRDFAIEEKWETEKRGCFQDRTAALVSGPSMQEEMSVDQDAPLCKAWINTGQCLKGAACRYRHDTGGETIGKARAMWVAERRRQRLVCSLLSGAEDA
ncbi:hypothetical protein GUITHDRAFT_99701 [Guillardia theta CCMP2712]|uniref:C3H1-type domain-containing protein n=1 Tax=Guillardia theta (strain CCMP2712) TaxID=905079 RepID=L1K373_GUITC|nr:hypothetical protein GUITHDRAFT_99701 [Guillardia theta CCMP2712]EKX55064.1 hypothetical protein GUITHDRAFT_99701 [Guillardia theta CCMP2712]|eukprot:XP_005842044.1 hypothetical protein GUITHDRAFT_99701 [Guillardia theta CCMP2712]